MAKKYANRNEEAILYSLKLLSGKWMIKVLWAIAEYSGNGVRFNTLQRDVDGISSLMLTRTLKTLIDNGFIIRKQFNEIPPHVEYYLTNEGLKLCPLLHLLEDLGENLMKKTSSTK